VLPAKHVREILDGAIHVEITDAELDKLETFS
jgi:hypothetical protein